MSGWEEKVAKTALREAWKDVKEKVLEMDLPPEKWICEELFKVIEDFVDGASPKATARLKTLSKQIDHMHPLRR